MPAPNRDPYKVLGLSPRASDSELHAAYRRLVQLHHPDHNGGSLEATRRFEEVQAAYAAIREQRATAPPLRQKSGSRQPPPRKAPSRQAPPDETVDPNLEARLADIERELREARAASEQARRTARAQAAAGYKRPSDEELGYVSTDDSFGKIFADARSELSDRLGEGRDRPADEGRDRPAGEGRDRPVGERVADLLDELAAKLRGERPSGSRD